jgi:hypothetical protein
MLAHQIGDARRAYVLMHLQHEAAHAARLGDGHRVKRIERPNLPAGSRGVGVEVNMDVDRANECRVGEAEIDRPAHRIDPPLVAALSARRLAGILAVACPKRQGPRTTARCLLQNPIARLRAISRCDASLAILQFWQFHSRLSHFAARPGW